MISKSEVLQGRDKTYPNEYNKTISDNLDKLLVAINRVRTAYAKPMYVTSGWRPTSLNSTVQGAAKASNHTLGLAVDLLDADSTLWKWCLANLELIKDCGLYLEDKRWTKTWVHFQVVSPRSGNRIFKAYTTPPPNPEIWDGIYDHSLNS